MQLSRKAIARITVSFAIALLLCLPCRAADSSDYVDALFAPPTAAELDAALEQTQYAPQCVDFAFGEIYKEIGSGAIFHITYTSDGYKQSGILGIPAGKGPFPIAIFNHSGFGGISGFDVGEAERFVQQGYVVALATYRGEQDKGKNFPKAEGPMDVLGDEVHDILNLMECAAALDTTDPDRIVMMGVSHGGGLTLSALLRTNRVKAAATFASPINLTAPEIRDMVTNWIKTPSGVEAVLSILVSNEGIKKLRTLIGIKDRDMARVPERRFEILRRSPTLYADRITVPLAMHIGTEDPVGYEQDCEAVAANLQARGIESTCVVFQGQGHALKREDHEAARDKAFEFFEKYLNVQ
jgi:dipeptidyl aminopeptidase/acylaminoacyl peptidase